MASPSSMSMNMSIDNASPPPMSKWSGWPLHMYAAKDEGNPLCCPAMGCRERWWRSEIEDPQLAMAEHWEKSLAGPRITRYHHMVLLQMYQLSRCLKCQTDFKLPNSQLPDSRALFKHHREMHGDEKDVSKIKGFIIHVRKYSDGLARTTKEEKHYCKTTWRSIFEYTMYHFHFGVAPDPLLNDFKALLGHVYTYQMPEAEFLQHLTVDGKSYRPVHPNNFLMNLEYQGVGKAWATKEHFPVIKAEFRQYYSEAKI